MSAFSLDSFQLIVALFMFYVAIRGSGTMYQFFDLSEETLAVIRPRLRVLYFLCGLIALAETGVCMLQNSMFTRTVTESGITVTQNYQVEALPFLSYELLSTVSQVLTIGVVVLLVGILIWLRIKARAQKKS